MSEVSHLLAVCDAVMAATGAKETTVSTRFLGSGKRIAKLRAGGDMGTRTISRAMLALSEAWPQGASWPPDVPRPAKAAGENPPEAA